MASEIGLSSRLSNNALVVRGGINTSANWENATGATKNSNGSLSCVSANCSVGKTVKELSVGIKNGQIGVSTVGEIRNLGGDVKATPNKFNPYHVDINGLSSDQGSRLFTPTIKNPQK